MLIEDNLLKLELKRVRDTLYNKAEQVLSLEKRKQQLQTAMEERTADIKVHKAMIETQIRIIEQERQTLRYLPYVLRGGGNGFLFSRKHMILKESLWKTNFILAAFLSLGS